MLVTTDATKMSGLLAVLPKPIIVFMLCWNLVAVPALNAGQPNEHSPTYQNGEFYGDDEYSDNTEEFMLLDEEDILEQGEMLRYLENASKEDVEQILQQNPQLQQKLLSKVRKVVRAKTPAQANQQLVAPYADQWIDVQNPMAHPVLSTSNIIDDLQPIGFVSNLRPSHEFVDNYQQSSMMYNYQQPRPVLFPLPAEYDYEYYDDFDYLGPNKLVAMQAKLQDKKAKWFRIGKSLKAKLNSLRLSKNLGKPAYGIGAFKPGSTHKHKDYHFHFDVLKSSDTIS